MKLAVSNIAWAPEDRDVVYPMLRDAGVTGLEIAPSLFLDGAEAPTNAGADHEAQALAAARAHGLVPCSMQSLLFGVEGPELFGSPEARDRMDRAMVDVCGLAGRLGVPNLVFGSPKNRIIPDGMDAAPVWRKAFNRMGDAALATGTIVALEPNPEAYGTNFMTSLAETLEVATAVAHPSVRVNLDLGALLLTGEIERIEEILPDALPLVSHVHLSVPHLEPITDEPAAVRRLVAALSDAGWTGWVSIEMRRNLDALRGAVDLARDAIEAAR